MKNSKIFYIILLLLFVLILSIFFGSSKQEGILFKDLSTMKTLLNGMDNDSEKIDLFKKMDISDIEFKKIIDNHTLNDTEKVAQLKILVSVLLTMGNVEEQKLADIINADITVGTVTKNIDKIRL